MEEKKIKNTTTFARKRDPLLPIRAEVNPAPAPTLLCC